MQSNSRTKTKLPEHCSFKAKKSSQALPFKQKPIMRTRAVLSEGSSQGLVQEFYASSLKLKRQRRRRTKRTVAASNQAMPSMSNNTPMTDSEAHHLPELGMVRSSSSCSQSSSLSEPIISSIHHLSQDQVDFSTFSFSAQSEVPDIPLTDPLPATNLDLRFGGPVNPPYQQITYQGIPAMSSPNYTPIPINSAPGNSSYYPYQSQPIYGSSGPTAMYPTDTQSYPGGYPQFSLPTYYPYSSHHDNHGFYQNPPHNPQTGPSYNDLDQFQLLSHDGDDFSRHDPANFQL
ncbi:hypothetical protein NP233_g5461 [Leucocoprinus birnbaumii]|uniref:Uncharacterized protein n=1 Tax=Leucocoprinus birnbaumii TaxID=56174 RepID=A0AAD5YWQ6_9AGAR|nr:hypothetical protein NP233_g5461 [Leucocoprinus birnbaumii]